MDNKRLILLIIFSFSTLLLWDAWQREHTPQTEHRSQQSATGLDIPKKTEPTSVVQSDQTIPEVKTHGALIDQSSVVNAEALTTSKLINVTTDLLHVKIDTLGGDIKYAELSQHLAVEDAAKPFVLMDSSTPPMFYITQSGLIGEGLPNHKSSYQANATDYRLSPDQQQLDVVLTWRNPQGLEVEKHLVFQRGSYLVNVQYHIKNGTSAGILPWTYFQILHDNKSSQGSAMMPTFTGGAYFTQLENYKKIDFKEMGKNNLSKNTQDGWVGLVQHYFVSAWIPTQGRPQEFYTKQVDEHLFAIGTKGEVGKIAAGASSEISAKLYIGPQTRKDLLAAAAGMEYTVDYGWLTVIATPLFWVLNQTHALVGNWGVAIILLTVALKLLFYPLSAAGYRSMAQMRELAPRLQGLKEKFGDDRMKMQQAMMELYKTEKINPMGGCLPILVQIPVFISLYWVLLGTVELRHAPFIWWIKDLSAIDPYYVLPVLMGLTMIIQTRLNPTPTDPMQAKIATYMPLIFSVFFFFFPSGLVLYWLVNNILSIAQQWRINQIIHADAVSRKMGSK